MTLSGLADAGLLILVTSGDLQEVLPEEKEDERGNLFSLLGAAALVCPGKG